MAKACNIDEVIDVINGLNMLGNYKFDTAKKECIEYLKQNKDEIYSDLSLIKSINSLRKRNGSLISSTPLLKFNEAISYISKEVENSFRAEGRKKYNMVIQGKTSLPVIPYTSQNLYFLNTYVKGNVNTNEAAFHIDIEECKILEIVSRRVIVHRSKNEFRSVLNIDNIGSTVYTSYESALNAGLEKFAQYNTNIMLKEEPVVTVENEGKIILSSESKGRENLREREELSL